MAVTTGPVRRRTLLPRPRLRGGLLTVAIGVLVVLALVALLAPLIAPTDPNAVDLSSPLSGASGAHLLGTDESGRDVLSRTIYGARTSLIAALVVVFASTALGIALGLISALAGGWVDMLISRAMDLVLALPGLLVAIVVVAIAGPGIIAPVIALSIAYAPYIGRLTRGAATMELRQTYVTAYRSLGFSDRTISVRYLLPNIAPPILAQATIGFGYALLDLATLSYLGLGVQPPAADWGRMISEGQNAVLQDALLPAFVPAAAIILTVVVVNLVGESLADRFVRRSS
jgi:peptide/nickel transport system permease protein